MGKKNRLVWLKVKINNLLSPLIYLIARLFYALDIWGLKMSYLFVLQEHKKIKVNYIPPLIINMLIIGEDRRYFSHFGIDIIAIFRAIISILLGKIQGASTITQQYIRVLTSNYEFTLRRKIKEIFLALLLNSKLDKEIVLLNYLNIAYFGKGMIGWEKAITRLNFSRTNPTTHQAASLISRLKYPDNKLNNPYLEHQRKTRTIYISNLFKKQFNYNNFYKGKRKLSVIRDGVIIVEEKI